MAEAASRASGPAPTDEDWVDAVPRIRPIPAADLPAAAFRADRTVRFGDCDPAGIVYTPRFVEMMNEAVERFFNEELGLDYYGLIRGGTGLGYGRIGCDFLRPVSMGETLELVVLAPRIGGASATFRIHGFKAGVEALRGGFVMVTTAIAAARPIPLPAPLRAALVAYQERCR
jgi:acyl-CoA thioesterase FadM